MVVYRFVSACVHDVFQSKHLMKHPASAPLQVAASRALSDLFIVPTYCARRPTHVSTASASALVIDVSASSESFRGWEIMITVTE